MNVKALFFLFAMCAAIIMSSCKKDNEPGPTSTTHNSFHFDGDDDRIRIPVPVDTMDEFTIEFKLKSELTNPACGGGTHFRIFSSSNALELAECAGAMRYYTGSTWRQAGGDVRDSSWHHVAYVKTATEMTVYLDGRVLTKFADTKQYNMPDTVSIGGNGGSESLMGMMDNVRFWSIARDSAAISTTMNSTLDGTESGLEAAYDFELTANATSIKDKSPHARNGVKSGDSGLNTSGPQSRAENGGVVAIQ